MRGLILAFKIGPGQPVPKFWELFGSIRQDLDRPYWCFPDQPWFGAPDDFDSEQFCEYLPDGVRTIMMLWKPGTLSRFADGFAEEQIELWGIEPADLPVMYESAPRQNPYEMIRQHARIWFGYTDGTCWEIYSRTETLLENLRHSLWGRPNLRVYNSHFDHRKQSFQSALGYWPYEV